jgi:hypothetical protein
MLTIEQVIDKLAEIDIDAELIEVFYEDNAIWIKVSNVETNQDVDGK